MQELQKEVNVTSLDMLNEYNKELEAARSQIHSLYELEKELLFKIGNVKSKVVLEEKMLKGTKWKITINRDASIAIRSSAHEKTMQEFAKFVETDYHCSFQLEKDVNVVFSDSDVDIVFYNPPYYKREFSYDELINLIKKYELDVEFDKNSKNIDDELNKLIKRKEIADKLKNDLKKAI